MTLSTSIDGEGKCSAFLGRSPHHLYLTELNSDKKQTKEKRFQLYNHKKNYSQQLLLLYRKQKNSKKNEIYVID